MEFVPSSNLLHQFLGKQKATREFVGYLCKQLIHYVGSMTAMTVFFPLDTARLRLQVDEKRKSKTTPAVLLEIIKEEGL
uniref:Uncharacterized protein n=1 Tax=Phasianus colchicus TaxID=9054 RepID=A0A669Q1U4_PHACC